MPRWLKIELTSGDEPEKSKGERAADAQANSTDRTVNVGAVFTGFLVVVLLGGAWWTRGRWTPLLMTGGGRSSAATVNGVPITDRDVDVAYEIQVAIHSQLGRELKDDPEAARGFRRDVLHELVDQELLVQAAADVGIAVTDEELEAELPRLGQGYGIETEAIRQAALAAGVTDEEFREWARRGLAVGRYVATDDARQKILAVYRERGYPVDQIPLVNVEPSEVASYLQRDSDIRFYFEGSPDTRAAAEGEAAPGFTLPDLAGRVVSLSDFHGQPVVVNFWATWCKPCEIEMPLFVKAYEGNRDEGLVILAVDVQEQPEPVRNYVASHGLTMPVVLDRDGQVATIYRVRGLPSTFFVDANGVLVKAKRGAITSGPELAALLRQILPGAEVLWDSLRPRWLD